MSTMTSTMTSTTTVTTTTMTVTTILKLYWNMNLNPMKAKNEFWTKRENRENANSGQSKILQNPDFKD
jgi:hypothetical protein